MPETIQLDVQLFVDRRRAAIAAALLELLRVGTAERGISKLQELNNTGVLKTAIDRVLDAIDGDAKPPA